MKDLTTKEYFMATNKHSCGENSYLKQILTRRLRIEEYELSHIDWLIENFYQLNISFLLYLDLANKDNITILYKNKNLKKKMNF